MSALFGITHWENPRRWLTCIAGLAVLSALAGCDRDEAKVYHVSKDDAPASAAPSSEPVATATPEPASPDMAIPPAMPAASLKYGIPKGWEEKPASGMRVATLAASGPNGASADISVIPLPIVGRDLELINMWRSNVQLPPTTDPDAAKQAEPIAIGSEAGRLFDFVSDKPLQGTTKTRMMMAVVTRGSISWFFKMTGEDVFVTSQKENFLKFLKSVSFPEEAPAPAPPTAPNDASAPPAELPPGWQQIPPAQFLLAQYSVAGKNGAKAEVHVAKLDGEGGGLLANVNRWRSQLGLGAWSESDLAQSARPIDAGSGKATLVDFTGTDDKTGTPTRLVGAVLSQNGQTWFFKLMGDPPTVAQQKEVFTKFIQSPAYANAP